jgi:hypothetical protein
MPMTLPPCSWRKPRFPAIPVLHGWNLGNHGFLTTELPFYVLGVLLVGFSPTSLHLVVAFQWALLSAVLVWMAAEAKDGSFSTIGALCALCISLYVATFEAEDGVLLYGPYVTLPAGTYAVTWYGCSPDTAVEPPGFVDVTRGAGSTVLSQRRVKSAPDCSQDLERLTDIGFTLE